MSKHIELIDELIELGRVTTLPVQMGHGYLVDLRSSGTWSDEKTAELRSCFPSQCFVAHSEPGSDSSSRYVVKDEAAVAVGESLQRQTLRNMVRVAAQALSELLDELVLRAPNVSCGGR